MFEDIKKKIKKGAQVAVNAVRSAFTPPSVPQSQRITPVAPPRATPAPVKLPAPKIPQIYTPAPTSDRFRTPLKLPETKPASVVDRFAPEAAARSAAIKQNVSPFLKNALESLGIVVSQGAQAADAFVVDQAKAVKEFAQGAYRVSPEDVGEGMYKTGAGALNVSKVIAQGIVEGVMRIGASGADAVLPGYKEQRLAAEKDPNVAKVSKFLTGREEMTTYQEIFAGADGWAKEKGATEDGAKFFAGFAVMGSLFMDSPIGGPAKGVKLGKNAVEAIAGTADEQIIKDVLKQTNPGLTDKAIEFITPALRDAATPEEVNTAIRLMNGANRTIAQKAEKKAIVDEAKAQPSVLYHGSAEKIDVPDMTKAGPGSFGRAFYMATDADAAKVYGKNVSEFTVSPEARILDWDTISKKELVDLERIELERLGVSGEDLKRRVADLEKKSELELKTNIQGSLEQLIKENRIPYDGVKQKNVDTDFVAVFKPELIQKPVAAAAIPPTEVVRSSIPRNAPIDVNLTKTLGAAKNPYEILSILKNEYPALPDRVVDRMVDRFVRTKRVKNVENLIRAARNLNEQFKPGGSLRVAGKDAPAVRAAAKEPKSVAEVLDKTTSPTARKVMSMPQKEAMIRTLKDKFENPKEAVAAQHEYNRIWDDLNQQIVDDYENLTLQKSFLEDVLTSDDDGIARVWKKLFTGANKKNAADDSVMELQEIHNRAARKKKAIENYRKFGASGDKLYPGNPGKLTKTEEYAVELDVWLQEAQLDDWGEAQARIERYAATRAEVRRIGEQLKEMKPRVREARILQEGLDDIAIIPQKDVEVIDRLITEANVRDYFHDISGIAAGTRDVVRNFEKFFGTKYAAIKKAVLDPFDASKGARVDEVRRLGDELDSGVVSKFGIKRGSKESAAIQRYGDTDLPAPERLDYEGLVKEFGKEKADNIVAADAWFRNQYDTLIDELNAVRKKIYPRNPAKLISKRKNYYRHYQEMSESFGDAIREFFDTPSGIGPELVGKSEFTKPKTRWLSFAQQRLGKKTELDAVGGFMQYAELFSYAKHIDPHVSRFRYLQRKIGEVAPVKGQELELPNGKKFKAKGVEGFLGFLDDFTRDLTGNTSPLDRWIQKRIPGGRQTIRAGRFVNNRMKANSVLANFGTMVAQVANVPMGIADTKLYAVPGMKRTLASIFVRNEPMMQSTFLKERYQQYLSERFPFQFKDRPVKATGDLAVRQAAWLMGKFDEMGTKFIWNSEYVKAVAKKIDDPIKYADDKTRKIVAGRGIGEVPVDQKALATQFLAPFTLEVGNAVWMMRDLVKQKDYAALMTLFVANYLFNEAAEEIRGSRVVFDPVNSLIDGSIALSEEWKEGNKVRGIEKFLGRQAGEVLANIPFGQSVAAAVPDSMVQSATQATTGAPMTKRDIFGSSTAGRFGTPLLLTGLQDAVFRLLPRVGGLQVKKSYQGLQALIAGHAEDKKGEATFDVPFTARNVVQALLFGAGATSEAEKYYDQRQDLFDIQSREDAEAFVRSTAAEDSYSKFKKLLAAGKGNEAADYLAAESAKDPLFAKALVQVIKDEKAGLNPNDRMIKMLGVENGERAKYIASQLKEMKSGDERANYLADLTEKKILTVDVAKQLALFMGQ